MIETGNMLTFAQQYQTFTFEELPFCAVDSLLLSTISYYDYKDSPFEKDFFSVPLKKYFAEKKDLLPPGILTLKGDQKLVPVLQRGGRHGDLRAGFHEEELDSESDKQFAAITFELGDGQYYIAFRGTDNSVVGWKEDFNLSFLEAVPSQKAAVAYAVRVMQQLPGRFFLGGHSKGGNLAIYCAMNLPRTLQMRLVEVYNHDGPGFFPEVYKSKGYQNIRPLIRKTVPQSSFIGMILEEDDNYLVVRSTEDNIMQHDPYSWVVEGTAFVSVAELDELSQSANRAFGRWLKELDFEKRRRISDAIFDIISGTGIQIFYELKEKRLEKIKLLIESLADMEPEEGRLVREALKRLLSISASELSALAKEKGMAKIDKRIEALRSKREG